MKRSADCADYTMNREWTRIDTNNCLLFAFIRVHSRLILLARGCGSAALCNLRNGLFAMLALAASASADPAAGNGRASPAPSANPYTIVNHMGEADQQVRLLEDKLLARRRTTDPLGIAIRGKFKGLPPVEQHPPATNLPTQAVKAATNELTLEKAIQQLPVGAVNITDREALIGFQSIHEGDLLVLELSGHRFVLWVESIDRRGVQFCDINLQNHTLKPFRFGPTQLPQASAKGRSDVRDFLKQDGN